MNKATITKVLNRFEEIKGLNSKRLLEQSIGFIRYDALPNRVQRKLGFSVMCVTGNTNVIPCIIAMFNKMSNEEYIQWMEKKEGVYI